MKFKVKNNEYDDILSLALDTITTHVDIEIADIMSKPMPTERDKEVFSLQWPFINRQWTQKVYDSIQNMILAIGLGLMSKENKELIQKMFTQEEITFMKENEDYYEFPPYDPDAEE